MTPVGGRYVAWGQAAIDGRSFGAAHLFWHEAVTHFQDGTRAPCGYNPGEGASFRAAAIDSAPCEPCLSKWDALAGKIVFPIGSEPADYTVRIERVPT